MRGVECRGCIHECICEKTGYHVLHGCIYYENRKEGYWTPKQIIVGGNGAVFMHDGYECKCGRVVPQVENYCPECGTRMKVAPKITKEEIEKVFGE